MALKIISHDILDCKSTVSHILVVETIYKTQIFFLIVINKGGFIWIRDVPPMYFNQQHFPAGLR